PKAPDDSRGLDKRAGQDEGDGPVTPEVLHIKLGGDDRLQRNAVASDHPFLDSTTPSHVEKRAVRFALRQRLRDGDRRKQVSARSAARDQHSHAVTIHTSRYESKCYPACLQ